MRVGKGRESGRERGGKGVTTGRRGKTDLFAHLLGGKVGVQARAVPVTGDGLRVDRDLDAKVLGDAVQQEARHPELVAHW